MIKNIKTVFGIKKHFFWHQYLCKGVMVEWSEYWTVVQKVAGSNPTLSKTGNSHCMHLSIVGEG